MISLTKPFSNDSPQIMTELPGPKAQAALERDRRYVSPSYTRIYPLVVARGSGSIIEDVDGNRFLDFTAGIAVTATGHCHPEVVAAIHDQSERLLHMSGTDFYYEPQIALAERLALLAPGSAPKKVFFTNSGTESVEAALKLSRYYTRRWRVLAFQGAFHGRTYGAMSLGASKAVHRRGFGPLLPGVHHLPYACSRAEIEALLNTVAPSDEVAAIFVEPILGEGGYRLPPPDFLPMLRELCDRHGFLLVADEIQSGMGRTGKMFAVQHFGVVPDIICVAKGIASGMPLGAIITRADLMTWPAGSHASTFGGNPVSCRAALVTIDLLEQHYLRNAEARGRQLLAGLNRLAETHAALAPARGLGLMVACDVLRDGNPDARLRSAIIDKAFRHGLLLLVCGTHSLRFCPPLCVTEEQVESALGILNRVLSCSLPMSKPNPAGS